MREFPFLNLSSPGSSEKDGLYRVSMSGAFEGGWGLLKDFYFRNPGASGGRVRDPRTSGFTEYMQGQTAGHFIPPEIDYSDEMEDMIYRWVRGEDGEPKQIAIPVEPFLPNYKKPGFVGANLSSPQHFMGSLRGDDLQRPPLSDRQEQNIVDSIIQDLTATLSHEAVHEGMHEDLWREANAMFQQLQDDGMSRDEANTRAYTHHNRAHEYGAHAGQTPAPRVHGNHPSEWEGYLTHGATRRAAIQGMMEHLETAAAKRFGLTFPPMDAFDPKGGREMSGHRMNDLGYFMAEDLEESGYGSLFDLPEDLSEIQIGGRPITEDEVRVLMSGMIGGEGDFSPFLLDDEEDLDRFVQFQDLRVPLDQVMGTRARANAAARGGSRDGRV